MSLLTLVFFFFCICNSLAIEPPPAGRTYELEATYNVDFSKDDDGGCQTYENKIKAAYGELIDLIQTSIDSINSLKQPLPSSQDSTEANEWKRKANTFFALFGTAVPAEGWSLTSQIGDPNLSMTNVFSKCD